MKIVISILLIVCLLIASKAMTGEQSDKENAYAHIHANIEKARAATEYDKKHDAYTLALMLVGQKSYEFIISCDDPELPEINKAMAELQSELWEMYNALKAAGNTPKYEPGKYATCEQAVAIKAKVVKERAEGEERRKAMAAGADASRKTASKYPQKIYISLRNESNREIVRMYEDGAVRNASNQKIGTIESNGAVKNASNQKIGAVESDGTVKNEKNQKTGVIESNGTVKNGRNQKIGMATVVKKEWAAAYFFFDFFK